MSGDPTPTDTNQGGNNPSGDGGGDGNGGGGPSGFDPCAIAKAMGLPPPPGCPGYKDAGTTTETTGGSSGGSGGGGAAAPIDPNISQGTRDYYSIWGTLPPTGYIENLVLKEGMNHFEIVEHELMKPRAQGTVFYRDKFAYYAQAAARIFGRR